MRRLKYLLREGVSNIRVNETTTIVAVATTAFTMACFGVFLLLYVNLRGVATTLQEDLRVVVYLEDGLAPETVSDLQEHLRIGPEVADVAYVSKTQALAEFREEFPSESYLLDGLGENPLPASLVVTLRPEAQSLESVKAWADREKTLPGVAQVQYNRGWIENLAAIVRYIEWTAIAVGSILAVAAVTIIGSTIRLTLYARRHEIEILRLIGATRAFIRVPYLLEGAFLGLFGSVVALALLKVLFEVFRLQLHRQAAVLGGVWSLTFFPVPIAVLVLIAGLLLGSLGSFMSLLAFERRRP